MTKTEIAWSDEVWNPVTGCTKVSAGCKNCYAEAVANRWWGKRKFTDVRTHPERLDAPLRWRKPRRVFVNSMSDLFHDDVPDEFLDEVFRVMMRASPSVVRLEASGFVQLPQKHVFQILTKRPERMRDYIRGDVHKRIGASLCWPLPCVWLGVSCENQETANERVPLLLETPAALRFLSCEPLLEELSIDRWLHDSNCWAPNDAGPCICAEPFEDRIDWVIVGGESGPGHRPMDLAWARHLLEQCRAAKVPFFMKQVSAPRPGQGEDALGEIVQEFPGRDSRAAGTVNPGGPRGR
jgi:protein gp37